MYSAAGSQGNAVYYKFFDKDAVIPTKDLMMLHLLRYSTNENDYNKTICLKEREMFNWNNIGFFFTGD